MDTKRIIVLSADGTPLECAFEDGECVLSALRRLDPSALDAPCGGAGTCGKCRVRVSEGMTPPPDAEEQRHLGKEALENGMRLACRLGASAGLRVAVEGHRGGEVIKEGFSAIRGTVDPLRTEAGSCGIAVDIGTTTVAAYLVDYGEAAVVAAASCLNRQRAFGADVIARIDRAMSGREALEELAELIRADLRSLAEQLLAKAGRSAQEIRDFAVVGNTTMLHLFAAVDPSGIATAPFTPAFTNLVRGRAEDYGLPYPRAELVLAPSIAGYVGGDITAGIRAVHMEEAERPSLLLDLGTNGEMALGDRSGILSCATAAGPAFEGAAISCGIGGVAGAVDSVYWQEGKLMNTTIGRRPPIGICGSGIIDAAACLVSSGIADETGALAKPFDEKGFTIAADLRFTQADLRQIQLAKAAVAAGIATLLKERGIGTAEVEKVYLAGGFGSYLRPESAARIGLVPPELLSKIVAVGNAAGHGALRMLLFKSENAALEALQEKTRYIELSDSAYFRDRYIEEMFFPGIQAARV